MTKGSTLPSIMSTDYEDISFLLALLAGEPTPDVTFYVLALTALGLSYSTMPDEVEPLLPRLEQRVLQVVPGTAPVAEDAEALGLASHVLSRHGQWNSRCREHGAQLTRYFDEVARLQWLRSPSVATAFLMGFAIDEPFHALVANAKAYLAQQLNNPSAEMDFPVILFGLTLAGDAVEVNSERVQNWLHRAHRPFRRLCMLSIVLKQCHHQLYEEAVSALQVEAQELYRTTVQPTLAIVRDLIAVVHLAALEDSADTSPGVQQRLPKSQTRPQRLTAVSRGDSGWVVEFRESGPVQPPTLDFLSFYLLTATNLELTEAYAIDGTLKTHFLEFLETWGSSRVKAIDRNALFVLISVSFVASIAVIFILWWPLSTRIYEWVMGVVQISLIESYLDDFLKWLIALPIYVIVGAAVALWLRGRVQWSDVEPQRVMTNLSILMSDAIARIRSV